MAPAPAVSRARLKRLGPSRRAQRRSEWENDTTGGLGSRSPVRRSSRTRSRATRGGEPADETHAWETDRRGRTANPPTPPAADGPVSRRPRRSLALWRLILSARYVVLGAIALATLLPQVGSQRLEVTLALIFVALPYNARLRLPAAAHRRAVPDARLQRPGPRRRLPGPRAEPARRRAAVHVGDQRHRRRRLRSPDRGPGVHRRRSSASASVAGDPAHLRRDRTAHRLRRRSPPSRSRRRRASPSASASCAGATPSSWAASTPSCGSSSPRARRRSTSTRRRPTSSGYPASDWREPGMWGRVVHPDDQRALRRAYRDAIRKGESRELEYRMIAADGRVVHVHDRMRVETDSIGRSRPRPGRHARHHRDQAGPGQGQPVREPRRRHQAGAVRVRPRGRRRRRLAAGARHQPRGRPPRRHRPRARRRASSSSTSSTCPTATCCSATSAT